MAKNLTLQDYFLQEYNKGNISKANLVDSDFADLVQQYHNGTLTFAEYSKQFYRTALKLIMRRTNSYPL
jgi:hypothetical protein